MYLSGTTGDVLWLLGSFGSDGEVPLLDVGHDVVRSTSDNAEGNALRRGSTAHDGA